MWAWGKYRQTLIQQPPDDHSKNETKLLDNLRDPGRMQAFRAMMRASKADIDARLSDVSAPSLIIMGADDPDYSDPKAEGELISERISGPARVEVLDKVGHYPMIDDVDQTHRLILRHLNNGADANVVRTQ